MPQEKRPVRLSGLARSRAAWPVMHPQADDLPGVFVLEFRQASGPGNLDDGRALIAALTPAELAEVIGAIPALSLTGDDENLRALIRIMKLLKGEG